MIVEDKNRRDFLKKGLAAFAAASAAGAVASCSSGEKSDKVKVLTPEGKVIEVDAESVSKLTNMGEYSIRKGVPGKKFVMVIDLARCKNAKKCVEACNSAHMISTPNEWLKVYSIQDNPQSAPYWQPTTCQHCDNPPCVKVCPVDATFKRQDGIVLVDNERCIGCRFCMAACPYSTRVFNWSEPIPEIQIDSVMAANHEHHHHDAETSIHSKIGTVDKCDFCPDMVTKGELPHCVAACPTSTFYFGNLYEDIVTNGNETVRLSEMLKERAGYRLQEDLGTNPSVYYLPPVKRDVDYEEGLENYVEFKTEADADSIAAE